MAQTTGFLTIGQFSTLTRLSVRMLRHYDTHGVLVPADIDPWTGYRRYVPHQLADAADLRNLRDVGFGVSALKILLAARGTPAWTDALRTQRESLLAELHAASGRVALVNRLLDQGEPTMPITLDRTTVPATTLVTLRGTVPTYADEHLLWGRMLPLLQAQGITPIGPCGVIEHDAEYTEQDVDLSIFFPVAPGTSAEGPLEIVDLPERDCLVARVRGPYTQITQAHVLITQRLAADDLRVRAEGTVADRVFNHYLTTPDQVAQEDLLTDVHVPLA